MLCEAVVRHMEDVLEPVISRDRDVTSVWSEGRNRRFGTRSHTDLTLVGYTWMALVRVLVDETTLYMPRRYSIDIHPHIHC